MPGFQEVGIACACVGFGSLVWALYSIGLAHHCHTWVSHSCIKQMEANHCSSAEKTVSRDLFYFCFKKTNQTNKQNKKTPKNSSNFFFFLRHNQVCWWTKSPNPIGSENILHLMSITHRAGETTRSIFHLAWQSHIPETAELSNWFPVQSRAPLSCKEAS